MQQTIAKRSKELLPPVCIILRCMDIISLRTILQDEQMDSGAGSQRRKEASFVGRSQESTLRRWRRRR